MKRHLQRIFFALILLAALAYGCDDLLARFRTNRLEVIRVDQVYAVRNRWNVVEYSIGTPVNTPCVHALMPHFGAAPCWYLKSRTLRINRGG
jgi:hypothetical protein